MGWRERLASEELIDFFLFLHDTRCIYFITHIRPMFSLLPFDIELCTLGGYTADRLVEIAVAPERVTPKIRLQIIWTEPADMIRNISFEVLSELGNTVPPAPSDEQMHMVWAEIDCTD